jgi:hypothetical protein
MVAVKELGSEWADRPMRGRQASNRGPVFLFFFEARREERRHR